jgi:23S rRNA pseudouridine1911/1915/1917 synthase
VNAGIKLSSPAAGGFWEIPVLCEDDHVLALDKPSGLLTSPDRHDPLRPSLIQLLHAGIAEGKPWARTRALKYLMPAHRLDSETSGVLLLTKSKTALVLLANLFGAETPSLQYIALVQGAPREEEFEVEMKIGPHPMKAGLMRVDPKHGKRARTRFRVLERFSLQALLQCEPQTARPHQVRVHLRHIGCPIVADALYGGRPLFLSQLKRDYRPKQTQPERPLIGRVALHLEQLRIPHPITAETLTLTAPWPKDLKVGVKYLRRFAAAPLPNS